MPSNHVDDELDELEERSLSVERLSLEWLSLSVDGWFVFGGN